MQIEQLYTGCLSQGAYYIESNGEAVVIDPLRETAPYLQRAKRDKATITYIFETRNLYNASVFRNSIWIRC